MREYALLVKNTSEDPVTIYFYHTWDRICWISWFSKIVLPGRDYLHRGDYKFKFQLITKKRELTEIQPWTRNKMIEIHNNITLFKDDLCNHPTEKKLAFQHNDFVRQKVNGRGLDLYAILEMSMKEVRGKTLEEQTHEIKDKYRRSMRKHHPDKVGGNIKIAQEIIMANEILENVETRIRYHNLVDYKGGWFSTSVWKSIFWPDLVDEDDRYSILRKRLFMTLGSLIAIGAGFGAIVYTGGLALVPMMAGSIGGFGLMSGGITGIGRSLCQDCTPGDWAKTSGIGFIGGALTGGVAGGAFAGIAGAGTQLATLTIGQQVGIGVTTASAGGVFQSVASDADRICVDKEEVTWKEVTGHAICGALVGTAVGAVGGAVGGELAGLLARSNADEVAATAAFRRIGVNSGKRIIQSLCEESVGSVLNSTTNSIEERLDITRENKSCEKYLVNTVKEIGIGILTSIATSAASQAYEEIGLHNETVNQRASVPEAEHHHSILTEQIIAGKNLEELAKPIKKDSQYKFTSQPTFPHNTRHLPSIPNINVYCGADDELMMNEVSNS